ncbi:hypothetical protein QN395_18570, partial [Undibacterium sp. RTI2.2]
ILNKKAVSPLKVFSHLGIEDLIGVKGGLFWSVGILTIGGAFILAMLNTFILKRGLKFSFAVSKVSDKITSWEAAARIAVDGLSLEEKAAVQKSVSVELDKRVKKYLAKRMLAELMCSIFSCVFFGSIFLIALNYNDLGKINFSLSDFIVAIFSLVIWLTLHRNSVRYAISRIIPLQIFLSSASGEVAFFIDTE